MKDAGTYEILSHVSMPECSIRIIRMLETEHVAAHYHEKCAQIYTVLEHQVEAHWVAADEERSNLIAVDVRLIDNPLRIAAGGAQLVLPMDGFWWGGCEGRQDSLAAGL